MDEAECARKFKIDLAFRMLSVGRTDLVPHALQLLPSTKVSSRDGRIECQTAVGWIHEWAVGDT